MPTIHVLTPWTGDGKTEGTAFRPKVIVDFPAITDWEDYSGARGGSVLGFMMAECYGVSPLTLAAVQANATHHVPVPDGDSLDVTLTAGQFLAVRTWLTARGLTAAQVNAAAGASVVGLTFRALRDRLKGWLKDQA